MPIVGPHKVTSRPVKEEDLNRVAQDVREMRELMDTLSAPDSPFNGVYALAHSQIRNYDPLRFFVLNEKNDYIKREWLGKHVIINPVIIRHVNHAQLALEGCVTFPNAPMQNVERWHKCEVTFNYLEDETFSGPQKLLFVDHSVSLKGQMAHIFQHEIYHFNAKYVYDINFDFKKPISMKKA